VDSITTLQQITTTGTNNGATSVLLGSIGGSSASNQFPDLQTALHELNKTYIFVKSPVGVLYIPERELIRKQAFFDQVANQLALDGKNVVGVGPAWMRSQQRLECTKLVYEPASPPRLLPDGSFNLYRGPGVEPCEGDIRPWLRLLDHVFQGKGSRGARKWFEQWVAYPLKHPGAKLFTASVFWGIQGAGKSILGEVIGSLYGDNYYELSPEELMSQFNEYMRYRQFILVNEIMSTGQRADADKLKAMITRERVAINRKYQPPFQVRDSINYLITSNHPDALLVDDFERRYFVHRVSTKLDHDVANEVANFKADYRGRAALLHHLINEVDLTDFDPHAPALETAARSDMVEAGMPDLDRFVRDKVDDAKSGKTPVDVTAEDLRKEFEDDNETRTNVKAVTVALQKFGARNLSQKRVSGKRARRWRLAEPGKRRPMEGEGI
jgi:hypothetical protein